LVSATGVGGSRRERVRAATVEEIKATARRLLVEQGPQSVTLRAIAREMGMTAPALYRYFPSHEDLLHAVITDIYDELADELEASRDELPDSEPGPRMAAMARCFRRWGVTHPQEFALVFATPLSATLPSPLDKAASRFAEAFIGAFFLVWRERPFAVPADDELPQGLVDQLTAYRQQLSEAYGATALEIPIGSLQVFLSGWVRLYGFVALEVFNHLAFCLADAEPAFETVLGEIAAVMGFDTVP
jgi:AcrR family transcriptional regulator